MDDVSGTLVPPEVLYSPLLDHKYSEGHPTVQIASAGGYVHVGTYMKQMENTGKPSRRLI